MSISSPSGMSRTPVTDWLMEKVALPMPLGQGLARMPPGTTPGTKDKIDEAVGQVGREFSSGSKPIPNIGSWTAASRAAPHPSPDGFGSRFGRAVTSVGEASRVVPDSVKTLPVDVALFGGPVKGAITAGKNLLRGGKALLSGRTLTEAADAMAPRRGMLGAAEQASKGGKYGPTAIEKTVPSIPTESLKQLHRFRRPSAFSRAVRTANDIGDWSDPLGEGVSNKVRDFARTAYGILRDEVPPAGSLK